MNNNNFKNVPKDFDYKTYIQLNPKLKCNSELSAKKHYQLHGFKEKRKYKFQNLPYDFVSKDYFELNPDLNYSYEVYAKIHYELYGFKENRKYKFQILPHDFVAKTYIEMNPDLNLNSELSAKKHYELYGFKENRIYKFQNLPDDFVAKTYIELNPDLNLNSELSAKKHYELHGFKENRMYKYNYNINNSNNINNNINNNSNSNNSNIKIYTKKEINLIYNGNIEIIYDISLLKPQDYCVFILDNYLINDKNIFELLENYIKTNSDVLSPTICCDNKLIYFGGIILNNKTYFFSEYDMNYDIFLNDNKKYVKNTTLFYPELFITNKSIYINNYNNSLEVLNHFDNVYTNNVVIKTNPFIVFEKNINEKNRINLYENISYKNIKSFYFEKENIYDFLKTNLLHNTHSVKMQNYKYLNNNTHEYILIIENTSLTPDRDCGSLYILNFIKILIKLKYNVHFISANFSYNDYTIKLQQLGVNMIYGYPYNICEYLKNNTNVYDYIFISRNVLFYKIYDLVKKYSNKSKIIYITHDLSHLRCDSLFNKNIEYENIKNSELSLIVSKYEYDYLIDNNFTKIYYYPICYENITTEKIINIENTKDFYFIGSNHNPNIECMTFFLDNIFNEILKIQKISLHLIGESSRHFSDYKNMFGDFLQIHGKISENNLDNLLSTIRLNIVPLINGAGVKGKIIESLNKQIPTISSSVGVQGLNLTNNINVIVLDVENNNYVEYAKKFIDYYNDITLLKVISENGKNFFVENYSNDKSLEYSLDMFNILNGPDNIMENNKDNNKDNNINKIILYKNKLPKICVLYQTYKNSNIDNENLCNFFNNYNSYYYFDIFIIINDEESYNNTINSLNVNNVFFIKGNNELFDFSGYQSGIEYLLETKIVDLYEAFIILNETINKNKPIFIENIILETFDFVIKNNVCCGNIDYWDINKYYQLHDNMINKWIRGNFYFMNKSVLKKINYKILYFTNTTNLDEIHIDNEMLNKINNWLTSNVRYKKYDNKIILNIKFLEILNEFYFSSILINVCDIHDIKNIKDLANNYFDVSNYLIYDRIPLKNTWETFKDFKKNKILLKNQNKIKLVFYHIPKSAEFSLRYFFKDKLEKKTILFEENVNPSILNNHEYLIKNYDVILNNVYYSDLLIKNTIFNITCLRDPVDRLINHFHFFDYENIGYINLVDFKNNDYNKFIHYCSFIGNLQFLFFSGFYDKIIEFNYDYEKIYYFIQGFADNIDIKNITYKTISQFEVILIFEKLKDVVLDLSNVNFIINKGNYSEDFKNELKTFCNYDYFIYNKFKHYENNLELDYIFDYLSEK